MTWSDEERRAWLFPPATGIVRGIDLALLDPSDENDRSFLIAFEHPEFEGTPEDATVMVGRQEVDPRLHLALHEMVANQIWDANPAEPWQTAARLTTLGYDRHEVLHMIMSVLSRAVYRALEKASPDPERITAQLDALPGSGEAQRRRPSAGGRRHPRSAYRPKR